MHAKGRLGQKWGREGGCSRLEDVWGLVDLGIRAETAMGCCWSPARLHFMNDVAPGGSRKQETGENDAEEGVLPIQPWPLRVRRCVSRRPLAAERKSSRCKPRGSKIISARSSYQSQDAHRS